MTSYVVESVAAGPALARRFCAHSLHERTHCRARCASVNRKLLGTDLASYPGKHTEESEVHMSNNEGTLDRLVRIAIGVALLSIVFIGPRTAWGLLGFVPLLTGLAGFCPIYRVLGTSSCSRQPVAHENVHP